jgi:hypothetical protein
LWAKLKDYGTMSKVKHPIKTLTIEKPEDMKMFLRVVRDEDHPYLTIYKEPLMNNQLTLRAKGLLSILLCNKDTWEVQLGEIASRSKEGRDVHRDVMDELVANHYVFRFKVREKGAFAKQYTLVSERPELLAAELDRLGVTHNIGKRKSETSLEPQEVSPGPEVQSVAPGPGSPAPVGSTLIINKRNEDQDLKEIYKEKKSKPKQANKKEVNPEVQALHDHYLAVMKPKASFKLSPERIKTYQKALSNHPLEECKQAILGCSRHDWSMGRSPDSDGLNNSPEIIFREKNFQRFFDMGREDYVKPAPKKSYQSPAEHNFEACKELYARGLSLDLKDIPLLKNGEKL